MQELQRLICKSRHLPAFAGHEQVERRRHDQLCARHRPPAAGRSALRRDVSSDRLDASALRACRTEPALPKSPTRASIRPTDFWTCSAARPRQSSCECERYTGVMLGQALNLINGPTIADAMIEPNNGVTQLVAAEKDDNRLIEEIFIRVLNRMPTAGRNRRGHRIAALVRRRSCQARRPNWPRRKRTLPAKQAAWEKSQSATVALDSARSAIRKVGRRRHAGQGTEQCRVRFRQAGEGHIHASPSKTDLLGITGIPPRSAGRSAFADGGPRPGAERQPSAERTSRVTAAPKSDRGKASADQLENAQADYNQPGWHVTGAIDGDPATGWAIDKQEGHDHVALFECHDPVSASPAARCSPSRSISNIPTAITSWANSACRPPRRSARSARRICRPTSPRFSRCPPRSELRPSKPSWPPTTARSTRTSARLLQAVAQHSNDRANARLLGAQDLVWALLNSPAFLFNH